MWIVLNLEIANHIHHKRPSSPNPFEKKVHNPQKVGIGKNGAFKFQYDGVYYYTKKGLKNDMIFPEISSYTALRYLGLKQKVTFLIDKEF